MLKPSIVDFIGENVPWLDGLVSRSIGLKMNENISMFSIVFEVGGA
ncbi:TPA: hypothetical protein SAN82_002019 [Pseudomonas putida]|nr:hypothetical protein [Pseudomonas putida]